MKLFRILSAVTVLILSMAALAGDDNKNEMYVYATYFNCDPTQEDAVDEQVQKTYRPIYNNAVKTVK